MRSKVSFGLEGSDDWLFGDIRLDLEASDDLFLGDTRLDLEASDELSDDDDRPRLKRSGVLLFGDARLGLDNLGELYGEACLCLEYSCDLCEDNWSECEFSGDLYFCCRC